MIAILFALEIEAGGTLDMFGEKNTTKAKNLIVHQGKFEGKEMLVGIIGTGAARAREGTLAFIQAHKPERIILAGFSGGLQSSLRKFDLVVIDSDGTRLFLDSADENKPVAIPSDSLGKVGPILTVDEVIHSAELKQKLGQKTGALVADMESASVAQVCVKQGLPFSIVRIVIDAMDETLPADIQHLTDQPSMGARLGAAVGAVFRRPGSLKDMVKLKQSAIETSDRLARWLSKLYL